MDENTNKIKLFFDILGQMKNNALDTNSINMINSNVLILFFKTKTSTNCYFINVNNYFNQYPMELNEDYFLATVNLYYPQNNIKIIKDLSEQDIKIILRIFTEKYSVSKHFVNKSKDIEYLNLISNKTNGVELYFPSNILPTIDYYKFIRYLITIEGEANLYSTRQINKKAETPYTSYYDELIKLSNTSKEENFERIDLFFNTFNKLVQKDYKDISALIYGNQDISTAYIIPSKNWSNADHTNGELINTSEEEFLRNLEMYSSIGEIINLPGLYQEDLKYISMIYILKYSARSIYEYNSSYSDKRVAPFYIEGDWFNHGISINLPYTHIYFQDNVISKNIFNSIKAYYEEKKYIIALGSKKERFDTSTIEYYTKLLGNNNVEPEIEKQKVITAKTFLSNIRFRDYFSNRSKK